MNINNQTLGIGCIMIGMIILPFMDALIKMLSGDYPLHEIVMARSVVALLLTLVIVHYEGGLGLLKTKRPWMHFARGLLIVIANMSYYMALTTMPLALVAAIFFISPLLITALSVPFLGERVGWRRWLAVLTGFCGVIIMMRVGNEGGFNLHAFLPILAAVGYAVTQIITRKIGSTEKASVMSFYIGVVFVFVASGFWLVAGDGSYAGSGGPVMEFLLRAWRMPDAYDFGLMLVIGLVVTIAGYMLSQAYRVAEANVVAPFEYVALPMAILWGYVFWQEIPGPQVFFGISLVVGSGIYVFIREQREIGPLDPLLGIEKGEEES